jgi:hypothetical protein
MFAIIWYVVVNKKKVSFEANLGNQYPQFFTCHAGLGLVASVEKFLDSQIKIYLSSLLYPIL